MKPSLHVTLTGVDEHTDFARLVHLSAAARARGVEVEWGMLYSPSRQGQPGRYPSLGTLTKALSGVPPEVRLALHFCGRSVFQALAGDSSTWALVHALRERNGRLQLNFNQRKDPVSLVALNAFFARVAPMVVITQYNQSNAGIEQVIDAPNHALLFDASGGRGLSPQRWPEPLHRHAELALPGFGDERVRSCGYAGGLGPDNIVAQLTEIEAVAAGTDFWIDMEGKLRKENAAGIDAFDLGCCEEVLVKIARHRLAARPQSESAFSR